MPVKSPLVREASVLWHKGVSILLNASSLASPGAPGDVSSSAETIAFCCTAPDLASAPYWKNRAPTPVPRPLRDPALQDAIFATCDRMVGVG